jgi:hypothetical protein
MLILLPAIIQDRGYGTSLLRQTRARTNPLVPGPRFCLRKIMSRSSIEAKMHQRHDTRTARLGLHQGWSDSTPKIAHSKQSGNRLRYNANRSRQRHPATVSHVL